MEKDEIIIRNAVMHILDSSVGIPVLSDHLLELTPDLNDFIRNHLFRLLSGDEMKTSVFENETSEVCQILYTFDENNLIDTSKILADRLYGIMNSNVSIPSADVFFVTFQAEGMKYLAMLKMNYKESYIHYTSLDKGSGNMNEVMKQHHTLPGTGGKVAEAIIVSLDEKRLLIAEKKSEVNGVKVNYLSEMFLQCHAEMSQKTKLDIVVRTVEQLNQKYYEDDFQKKMEAKSVIYTAYAEQGTISVPDVGEELFGDIPEIKEEFTEKIQKYCLPDTEIQVKSERTTKKFGHQILQTDTGIEISIPMEEYNNNQNVEFITNPDGTTSVLIKNIGRITSK